MRITSENLSRLTTPGNLAIALADSSGADSKKAVRDAIRKALPQVPLISTRIIAGMVRGAECIIAAAAGALLLAIHPGYGVPAAVEYYFAVIAAVAIGLPFVLQAFGSYSVHALLRPADEIARIAMAWTLLFASAAVLMFLAKASGSFSRLWLASWYLAGFGCLAGSRIVLASVLRHWNTRGQLDRRAVIIGGGEPARSLASALRDASDADVSVIGVFDDRDDDRSPVDLDGLRKLGTVSDLVDFVRQARVDLLIVTLPLQAEERLLSVLKTIWVLPVDIRLSAYTQKLRYRPRAYSYIGNIPFIDVFDRPLGDWGKLLKNIEDKVIAFFMVTALLPVMALVALAVKVESRGPVLFRQKRYGFNNELIEIYKFRSMYHDQSDMNAARLVTKDDPRVTRVGRFIRKTSLDELPQLFNVLKGDLSLVGPRPHATRAKAGGVLYDEVVDGYLARHRVKPGITGWAQVNGWRGETDTKEKLQRRVEHDLYYIENWSLALDLYILAMTPVSLMTQRESAY